MSDGAPMFGVRLSGSPATSKVSVWPGLQCRRCTFRISRGIGTTACTVLIRTSVPPFSLARAVRAEIRSFNRRIIVDKLDTVENMLAESVAVPRFYMMLVAGFAVLALAVSAVGVYGIINYSVARRTHEIGIRMALGAERGDVLAMILRQGLRLMVAGVALGLAGAWVSTRVLETLLFGVRPSDGVAFACGSGVLVLAALLACYIPARRATRVDPLEALRHE